VGNVCGDGARRRKVGTDPHRTETIEKGTNVSHIESSTEIPTPQARCLAALRGLHGRGGSGAPAARSGFAVTAVGVALCLALLVPSGASAHFVRPFLRQFTGTPTGKEGAVVPFNSPTAVATDDEGNLWALDSPNSLDEFGPSGVYSQALEVPSLSDETESLAIGPTGTMYVAGRHPVGTLSSEPQVDILSKAGVLEKTFDPSLKALPGGVERQTLAADDSTDPLDPSAGDLYYVVTSGQQSLLQKFNAAGEGRAWEGFKGSANCYCSVSGNEILFNNYALSRSHGVAVDPASGDIWVQGRDGGVGVQPKG
jgi:hypothetical protein